MSEARDTKITTPSGEELDQISGGDATAGQTSDVEAANAASHAYKTPAGYEK